MPTATCRQSRMPFGTVRRTGPTSRARSSSGASSPLTEERHGDHPSVRTTTLSPPTVSLLSGVMLADPAPPSMDHEVIVAEEVERLVALTQARTARYPCVQAAFSWYERC